MWIYLNEGVLRLKVPVLTTYLITIFKLIRAGKPLKREELVVGRQKPDTLSKHLNKAIEAGLLEKVQRRVYDEERDVYYSLPNIYTICNPTIKARFKCLDEITEWAAYQIQKQLGKVHTNYIRNKYDPLVTGEIELERLSEEDYSNNRFREDISALGITGHFYTK
ncbi:MAG: hypothetical protein MSA00_00895 [Bacteroidales bacterium]|nr:hypothetical protein [Bacteroidales bacterium]